MIKLVRLVRFALALLACSGVAHGQPSPPAGGAPPGPAPAGLVVGSGNFYSPIVADLDEAVAFYRDGIGFDVQGEPTSFDANPQLRAMFGLPDASLRQLIGRAPPIQGGVEIVEISRADGRLAERTIRDPGAVMLIVGVRNIDATLARLTKLGAPLLTTGGAPVPINGGPLRGVLVQDPAGHFVELLQGMPPPPPPGGNTNVASVRVRHTVADLERSLGLYRDTLGLQGAPGVPRWENNQSVLGLLGLPSTAQYRFATLTVPTSGLAIELLEFRGARRPAEPARVADPGSTRIQLRVSNIDAAVAALTQAGGAVVSTGGGPLDLPAGNTTLRVAMVRDPDGLFVVLIQAPLAPR
jgi:catechol 2,3-dioxygenase-like lactoylglutathione lyase family enzyme